MATKVPVVAPVDLGRGIVRNEQKKKYEVDLSEFVDGDTITYEGGKLKGQPQSSGLDCSAIGALKTVAMDKTIKVLGKKGDECVQVAVLDSIFQDVGVGLSASKYTGFVGDSFNVKVTVTNTGEGTNEDTTLSIIKPSLGSYTIQNQSHTSQGAGSVTKVSDTEYTIRNLAKGGTVIVTFDVIGSSHGTYQFSATVDPKSALDTNATNHRATISLNVNTKADTGYVATADCPAIVVTDVALNKTLVLQEASSISGENGNGSTRNARTNFYENGFTNKQFRLAGASTVVVANTTNKNLGDKIFSSDDGSTPTFVYHSTENGWSDANGRKMYPNRQRPFGDETDIISGYTFSNGVLTITDTAIRGVVVAMRPAGTNCKWQYFTLGSKGPAVTRTNSCDINATGGGTVQKTSTRIIGTGSTPVRALEELNVVTLDTNRKLYKGITSSYSSPNNAISAYTTYREAISQVDITVKKQTTATINVVNTCENVSTFVSRGAVTFTPSGSDNLTISVSNRALPTDSIQFGMVRLNVVD